MVLSITAVFVEIVDTWELSKFCSNFHPYSTWSTTALRLWPTPSGSFSLRFCHLMGPSFCAEKEVDSLGEMKEDEEVDRPSSECCIGDDDLPLHHNIQGCAGRSCGLLSSGSCLLNLLRYAPRMGRCGFNLTRIWVWGGPCCQCEAIVFLPKRWRLSIMEALRLMIGRPLVLGYLCMQSAFYAKEQALTACYLHLHQEFHSIFLNSSSLVLNLRQWNS